MTNQITVKLSPETAYAFAKEKWQLQIYKGVQGDPLKGKLAVWLALDNLGYNITISSSATEGLCGYIDDQTIEKCTIVNAVNEDYMKLGQLQTLNTNGEVVISNGSSPNAISFYSLNDNELLCGLAGVGAAGPYCAFPLPGYTTVVMAPYEMMVFTFTQIPKAVGTIVETITTPSAQVVFLSSTQSDTASLYYDIKTGWSKDPDEPYITINEGPINLAEVLIIPFT